MKPSTVSVGQQAEALAVSYLEQQGYRLVIKNYRCRLGEIDIVAYEGETLCFVEVRSTDVDDFGGPLATVNQRKQQHIIRVARHYLVTHHQTDAFCRFDVLGIIRKPELKIMLVRGAFSSTNY